MALCGLAIDLYFFLKKWYKAPTPLEKPWDPPVMPTKKCILYECDPPSDVTGPPTDSDREVKLHRTQQWEQYGSKGALLTYEIVGPQPD